MLTHLDSIFFTGPYLMLAHLSATVSGVDCLSPCPVANCLSALFSSPLSSHVPLPLLATPRFQVQKPFVWFRVKTDKGIVCLAGHLYSVTVVVVVDEIVLSLLNVLNETFLLIFDNFVNPQYAFTQFFHHSQDVVQGQFSRKVLRLTKAKEPCLPYLLIAGVEIKRWIHAFHKSIKAK